MPFDDVKASAIRQFHDACLAQPDWAKSTAARFEDGPWKYIEINHRCNCQLWDEEDLARRRDVPDSEIAANKRAIDGFNQRRNDAIEHINDVLLERLAATPPAADAWLNSETAGSIIDRLSILALKIHHMALQTGRTDVGPEHIASCQGKLARLQEQRTDLEDALDRLLAACAQGRAYFKVYRQFKMYNDPALNPCLYGAKGR